MMRAGEPAPKIARDNLALAAMDDRIFRKRRRAPAQQALWLAVDNGGAAAPPPSRRCDQEPAAGARAPQHHAFAMQIHDA